MHLSARQTRTVLALIWACFLLRGAFYSMQPLWDGWDEWSHFAVLQHLVNGGGLPNPQKDLPSREIVAALEIGPVPWSLRDLSPQVVTHERYWALPPAERRERQRQLMALPAEWRRQTSAKFGALYEGQQPPLYYWLLYIPMRLASPLSLPSRVLVLRLASVAIASFAIPIGFLVARRVFGSPPLALAVTALVAAMPVFAIDVARVGNEAPAVVLYTLLLWLAIKAFDADLPPWWWIAAGSTLGLGLLTKAYFLTALPALAAVCLYRRRRNLGLQCSAAFALAAFAGGWWYAYIRAVTGTISGQIQATWAAGAGLETTLRALAGVNWGQAADTLLLSYVWFGAANFLQVRAWMVHFFACMLAFATAGLVVTIVRARPPRSPAIPVLAAFLVPLVASLAYHVLVTYLLIRQSMSNGWYLYCLVFAEVPLVILGLGAIVPGRLRKWLAPAGALCFAALDLFGANFLLLPYGLGLIGHRDSGGVPAFHVSQLAELAPGELFSRLAANRPYLPNAQAFVAMWAVYVAATLALVVIAFWCVSRPPSRFDAGPRHP